MRLALLIYGSLDTLSGGYLYDRKLVEYLRQQGDRVNVISLPWRNYASHMADNFSRRLRRQLDSLQVDLFIQDELNHPSLFWLNRWLRARVAFPLVSIVHHLRSSEPRASWLNILYREIERAYLKTMDGFIYNSQTTQGVVEDLLGRRLRGVVAYPAGNRLNSRVDRGEILRRAKEIGPLRMLFLGNVIPRKGLHVLIDALALMRDPPWTLSVTGSLEFDHRYANAVQKRVNQAGIEERVSFLGPLQKSELAAHIQQHHVLVVPSYYEGYGIAYLEAMGFGLPVIASTAGGAGEIVTHGQDGYLVQPGDVTDLREYLEELCRDRQRLARMGVAALERFLAHPTWEQTGAQIRTFLHNV